VQRTGGNSHKPQRAGGSILCALTFLLTFCVKTKSKAFATANQRIRWTGKYIYIMMALGRQEIKEIKSCAVVLKRKNNRMKAYLPEGRHRGDNFVKLAATPDLENCAPVET